MKRFTLLLLLILFMAACAAETNLDQPPEIRYGEDVCERCGMIISDARYAASYVTPDGDVRRFDDIGGMLAHYQESGDEVHVFWVHDVESEEWLKAEAAYFVVAEDLMTPMGFGIAAIADEATAIALAQEYSGNVLAFADLLARAEAGDLQRVAHGHDHHK